MAAQFKHRKNNSHFSTRKCIIQTTTRCFNTQVPTKHIQSHSNVAVHGELLLIKLEPAGNSRAWIF